MSQRLRDLPMHLQDVVWDTVTFELSPLLVQINVALASLADEAP